MHAASVTTAAPSHAIVAIDQRADGATVRWGDGYETFFHYIWLRDVCHCEDCGDCYSSNRYFMACDAPLDISPQSLEVTPDHTLAIVWAPDGHASVYDPRWLRDHAYDAQARSRRQFHPVLWSQSDTDVLPRAEYPDVISDDASRLKMYRSLCDHGLVIVSNGPTDAEGIISIADLVGEMGDAAYGKVFDLSPKSAIGTLGNTLRTVPPHNDEPFRYNPPGMLIIHCVRPAADGGDSVLVDGFRVAETLRQEQPAAFERLTRTAQPYIRVHDGELDQRAWFPLISLDAAGAVCGIRIHTRSMAPLDLPADEVIPYYEALQAITTLMMQPEHQVRLRLTAGQSIVLDNHRVLHARTQFSDPERWYQTCNVSRESFHERLRLLAAKRGEGHEPLQVLPAGSV